MKPTGRRKQPTRRMMLGGIALLGAVPAIATTPALAQASVQTALPRGTQTAPVETFGAAESSILAGRTPLMGAIAIDMPPLSENGNAVDLAIKVASPMTAQDHVRRIHVLAERNPFPRVGLFHLGVRSGRAEVATRIRLADTQNIVIIAETSTGAVHLARQEVVVILGACLEGG
jgi:sulfur-oxidizing protein SoxY